MIPLSSQREAGRTIEQAKASLSKGPEGYVSSEADSETSEGDEIHEKDERIEDNGRISLESLRAQSNEDSAGKRPSGPERSSSNVAEDVISKKGQYGRFAERWFSRKGWSTDKRRAQGMSTADDKTPLPEEAKENVQSAVSQNNAMEADPSDMDGFGQARRANIALRPKQGSQLEKGDANVANTLLPKLLRTTRMLLMSRSFFFSYDIDITRRLGSQEIKSPDLPLHKSVDPLVSLVIVHAAASLICNSSFSGITI